MSKLKTRICSSYSPLTKQPNDLYSHSSCKHCAHFSKRLGRCDFIDELPPEDEF